MATRTQNSTSPLLVLILLVLTFPIWIALGGALFGLIIGLCGAVFAVVVAIFGVAVAIIALPFKILFGWGNHDWGDWSWHVGPHINGYVLVAIIIVIVLAIKAQSK